MSHPEIQEITIETIDRAIHRWFDRTVDAHVEFTTGDRKKVPVIFSSGERFATSRTKRGIRDKNGVLILPLISIQRTSIDPNPSMQGLGIETPTLQFAKRVAGKTNNLKNLDSARPPSNRVDPAVLYDVYTIPFPDRSIMNYELVIQTQYTTQMNAVLQKIFHELDLQKSFVASFGDEHKHPPQGEPFETRKPLKEGYVCGYFEAESSDNGNLDEFTDQERIIRWTTSIRVPATLQLDPEGEKPSVQIDRTSFGLKFGDENVTFVDDPYELEIIFGKGKVSSR